MLNLRFFGCSKLSISNDFPQIMHLLTFIFAYLCTNKTFFISFLVMSDPGYKEKMYYLALRGYGKNGLFREKDLANFNTSCVWSAERLLFWISVFSFSIWLCNMLAISFVNLFIPDIKLIYNLWVIILVTVFKKFSIILTAFDHSNSSLMIDINLNIIWSISRLPVVTPIFYLCI